MIRKESFSARRVESFQLSDVSPAAEGDTRGGDEVAETEGAGIWGVGDGSNLATSFRDAASLVDERRVPSFTGKISTFESSMISAVLVGVTVEDESWRALPAVEEGTVFRIFLGREDSSEATTESEER